MRMNMRLQCRISKQEIDFLFKSNYDMTFICVSKVNKRLCSLLLLYAFCTINIVYDSVLTKNGCFKLHMRKLNFFPISTNVC